MSSQPLTAESPAVAGPPDPEPQPAPPAGHTHRRWPGHLAAAVVYLGLGMLVMANFVTDPNGRITPHLPMDHTWFQWLLSHGAYSVRHLSNPFFSVQQNFPTGVNMMANTSVLGVTLPLAPVTILLGTRVTYLVWMVGAAAATAFATYWVLQRHVVRSRAAAFLAGAFAGFAPGVIHHANGQPNFVSNFALPFIAVQVIRLGISGRWLRDGVILGLLVTYQVFINEEVLLVTATACAIAVLVYTVMQPRKARGRMKSFALGSAVTVVTAGVLCCYPLWFQFHGPGTYTSLPLYQTWGEDPYTYLLYARDTIFGDPSVERNYEQNSYFGWPLTALVVASVVLLWRRYPAVRVAAVVAVVCGALSLGPQVRFNGAVTDIPGPWHYIPDHLPILGMLTPSRITYAVIGVFALVIALAWDALGPIRQRETTPGRARTVLGMGLIVVALIPLIPKPLPAVDQDRPPVFITSGAWRPYVPSGRSLIPVPVPNKRQGLDSLSWSAWESEYPVPEGYFLGPDQNGFGHSGPVETSTLTGLVTRTVKSGTTPTVGPKTRAAALSDLQRFKGSVVVMRARPENENLKRMVEQLLGPGQQQLDVWLWPVP